MPLHVTPCVDGYVPVRIVARGLAQRVLRARGREARALRGERVEPRRRAERAALDAERVGPLLVGRDQQDVHGGNYAPRPEEVPIDVIALLDEVRAIAQTGLHYATDPFDRERYEHLLALASHEYADRVGLPADAVRARFQAEVGYITAKVGVDAALFDENDRILLIRRVDDGRWGLIAGFVEPNESPELAIVREIEEEVGLVAEIDHLVGAFGPSVGRLQRAPPRHRLDRLPVPRDQRRAARAAPRGARDRMAVDRRRRRLAPPPRDTRARGARSALAARPGSERGREVQPHPRRSRVPHPRDANRVTAGRS